MISAVPVSPAATSDALASVLRCRAARSALQHKAFRPAGCRPVALLMVNSLAGVGDPVTLWDHDGICAGSGIFVGDDL
ncbi:hypothetical protein ABT061_01525 [Streptosporangium sp. NPDC002544]|uniref:hypothetical protein n=1 Tax=Streptosporangium sp. NPDC002544 TaxID=3154538 RepID=UPI0033298EDB